LVVLKASLTKEKSRAEHRAGWKQVILGLCSTGSIKAQVM